MTNFIRNKRIYTSAPFDLESTGAGVSLVTNDDKVKSLIAGTNVVITDNGDTVIIGTTAEDITIVANYSALPNPTTVAGLFYWVSNSQGTQWLPGSLGGTYYNKGLYYSNGVSWEYIDTPYQATLAEVNAGVVTDKFVTPNNLYNSNYVRINNVQTLTNKRITARISTSVSAISITPNSDLIDLYTVTALSSDLMMNNPTGTPTEGQVLVIRIKDDGTLRNLTYGTKYRFSIDLPAPLTTIINKTLYLCFIYNAIDDTWDCINTLNDL